MATAQSVILPYGQPFGFAGQATHVLDSQSAANKEASLSIAFGTGVKPGVNVKEALLPTASNSVLAGIVRNAQVYAPGTFGNITSGGLIPNTMMELVTEGRIYVPVSSDTVAGNDTPAYWVFQTGGSDVIGQFRDTSNANTVDVTKQVTFKGVPLADPSALTGGTSKICEVYVSISNKP